MSLSRGKYGVEYNPRRRDDDTHVAAWIVLAVAIASIISFVATSLRRSGDANEAPAETREKAAQKAETPKELVVGQKPVLAKSATNDWTFSEKLFTLARPSERPPRVKNLLLRLEEAEKSANLAMQISTIEDLRSIPGEMAADLDDALSRRLGELNLTYLFDRKNGQWVAKKKVRSGESASRIAHSYGSSLKSLFKLNGIDEKTKIPSGSEILVMDHPRLNLVVRKRSMIADLFLNGKFFKRYDVEECSAATPGYCKLESDFGKFLHTRGIRFSAADAEELATILPQGASITIAPL